MEYKTPFYHVSTDHFSLVIDEDDFNGAELIQELVERCNPETIDAKWFDEVCIITFGTHEERERVYLSDYKDQWFREIRTPQIMKERLDQINEQIINKVKAIAAEEPTQTFTVKVPVKEYYVYQKEFQVEASSKAEAIVTGKHSTL